MLSARPVPRILVVDDDPAICAMCAEFLTDEGYRVTTAADGQAALDSLAGALVDLILMDLSMPRMDGLTACIALQGNPRTHFIPIVIISAASETLRDRADLIACAAAVVLPKPFDLDTLLTTVQALVGGGTEQLPAVSRA
jgi:CheY-like chemotaxis protein